MMPKISIFMSSYNYAEYLPDAIESVLNQTFQDFELYIVDDASTDESWQIIQSYSDPRIIAHRNPINQHSVAGMNHFISDIAKGDLIAVHHSDNVWEPEKLQTQLEFLESHPDIGAVFTRVRVIDEDGEDIKDSKNPFFYVFDQPNRSRHEWLKFFFMQGNALCHPSVLMRKNCYDDCGLYRFGLGLLLDMDMWVRLCLKHEIYILPEKLVSYRVLISEKNISGNRPDTRLRYPFEYLKILDNYRKIPTFDDFVSVFPSAQKHEHHMGWDIGYVLGMTALEERGNANVFQLFGLNLLFEVLQDSSRAEKVESLYGFTHKDFIKLTGQYDIFSNEIKSDLRKRLAEKLNVIEQLRKNVKALRAESAKRSKLVKQLTQQNKRVHQELDQLKRTYQDLSLKQTHMESTPVWKIASKIKNGLSVIAPENSLRRKLIKEPYRRILRPIIFRKEHKNLKVEKALVARSGLFDRDWYLKHNPDVAASKIDPLEHFIRYGGLEGRDPGPNFDSRKYLESYKEVRQKGINPLIHYLQSGNEGD